MASEKGIFGQADPAATTEADLYEVPTSFAFTGYVIAANRSGATTIRVSVSLDGGVTSSEEYLAYDQVIAANDSIDSKSFSVQAGSVVRVYSDSGNVSFSLTGIKQDA